MESMRDAFAGKAVVLPRVYISLRDEPNASGNEVPLPRVGEVAPTDVWAEVQVGTDERTFQLIATRGLMVEDWAVKGLERARG